MMAKKDVALSVGVVLLALGAIGSVFLWEDHKPLHEPEAQPRPAQPKLSSGPVLLRDVTGEAGLNFVHNNGAFGAKWIPESLGSGAAFFDFDNDGDADLFFVNGRNWTDDEHRAYADGPGRDHRSKYQFETPANRPLQRSTGALFRNDGGRFLDITDQSGLGVEMYGFGVAAGDYDNDGRCDLCVTSLNKIFLFHNEGDGRFSDQSQLLNPSYPGQFTSAAWLDYNRDGKLDLFVCRYVKWSPEKETSFTPSRPGRAYSGPLDYESDSNALFLNNGRGFSDVSKAAGIAARVTGDARKRQAIAANGLGVAVYDFNTDGWPDILVASDLRPNLLFRNNRNGTFTELGVKANLVFSLSGVARAGMGIDAGDAEQRGHDNVVVGNFSRQGMGFHSVQHVGSNEVLYADTAPKYELLRQSELFVTFGCQFADLDNDSWLDILASNGHVRDDADTNPYFIEHGTISYAQRPLLLWNRGRNQTFKDVGLTKEFPQPEFVGRGLACADYDTDGDLDVLFTTLNGAPKLFRNESGAQNSVRLELEGTPSNRSAIGARIEAQVGKTIIRRRVKSGSSYLSQSELPLTVGIGQAKQIDSLKITWPNGKVSNLSALKAGAIYTVREVGGVVKQTPLRSH